MYLSSSACVAKTEVMLGVGDGEVWLIPGRGIFPVHLEVTSFLAPGQETPGSSAAVLLWEGREKHVKLGSVCGEEVEKYQVHGAEAWEASLSRQGDVPGLNPTPNGHMWITMWSFWKGVIWGELIFDSCFTFIFKVEYFFIIGDNGLEKPF